MYYFNPLLEGTKSFIKTRGVRQSDSLLTLLCHLERHKIFKKIDIRLKIVYKSKQVLAYAD